MRSRRMLVAWSDHGAATGRGCVAGDLPLVSRKQRGQSRETWHVRSEPAGDELRKEPHALRLTRFALREEPERAVHVQGGARHPHQQRVGILDEARRHRHPGYWPHCEDCERT
jgi:hypothetical protein